MEVRKIKEILREYSQPGFRLEQIKKAIYKDGASSFLEITNLPRELRKTFEAKANILSFSNQEIRKSKNEKAIKASLLLKDGNFIETVLISPQSGVWSVCLSSQVGCPLGCKFCQTGQGGFKRNLTAEEITDQILFWKQWLKKEKSEEQKISNIVFMGMGEPFLNWKNVTESLKIIMDEKLLGFGSRSISISTAGIPEGIENLAKEFPQINLAISLHFASSDKRDKFMPINLQYDLEKLKNSLKKYFSLTRRKVFIEYIMMSGVNDKKEDAYNLEKYLRSIGDIRLLHINLISYNPGEGEKLKSSGRETMLNLRNYFLKKGINCTIRKSLGLEIQGACGQLTRYSKTPGSQEKHDQ